MLFVSIPPDRKLKGTRLRSRKALINTSAALLEEVVSVVCGFILPMMILQTFGSASNGLTASITQILNVSVLLRAGVGGATRAALYRPLAQRDKREVDAIMKATAIFMRKIALLLGSFIVVFACIYPFFVADDFGWLFAFTLVLVIGISTFAESLFGITYQILLQADQREYVFMVIKTAVVALNTSISVVLMNAGAGIHVVMLGSSLALVLLPISVNLHVTRSYRIDKSVEPDTVALDQRWDSFAHQAAVFVSNNLSIITLTIFSSLKEVSVFVVYNLVGAALKRVVTSITNGIEAAFGNMIARDEGTSIRRSLDIVEGVVFLIATTMFTCAGLLISQFVAIYTKGITDVNYTRPVFAMLFLVSMFFFCVRLPYQLIIQAAGHYRQTRRGAMAEIVINVVVSVVCVIYFGLVGVAIGALLASLFRMSYNALYVDRVLVQRGILRVCSRVVVALVHSCLIVLASHLIVFTEGDTYLVWIHNGLRLVALAVLVSGMVAAVFYRDEARGVWRILRRLLFSGD